MRGEWCASMRDDHVTRWKSLHPNHLTDDIKEYENLEESLMSRINCNLVGNLVRNLRIDFTVYIHTNYAKKFIYSIDAYMVTD